MKNKKGFTLIELIVVIAILGILAAVAIPRFSGFQDSAKKRSDISNAKLIANAIQVAIADEKLVEVYSGTPSALTSITDKQATPATVINATAATIPAALTAVLVPAYMESMPKPKYENASNADFSISIVSGKITLTGPTAADVAYPVPAGDYAN